MHIEVLQSFAANVAVSCSPHHTASILLVSEQKMELFVQRKLVDTYAFGVENGPLFPASFSASLLTVFWSPHVENLFALLNESAASVQVFHFDGYALSCIASLHDELLGPRSCVFVAEDLLVLTSGCIPERIAAWTFTGSRPLAFVDAVKERASGALPVEAIAGSNGLFVLGQRMATAAALRDAFSVFCVESGALTRAATFGTESAAFSAANWFLSHDGTRLFVSESFSDFAFSAFSVAGRLLFSVRLPTEAAFIVDAIEVDALGIVVLLDSEWRVTCIDAETGGVVSFAPLKLLPDAAADVGAFWARAKVIKEADAEFLVYRNTPVDAATLTHLLGATFCSLGAASSGGSVRRFSTQLFSSTEQNVHVLAVCPDCMPNRLFVLDLFNFVVEQLFIFKTPLVHVEWNEEGGALSLVMFCRTFMHVWKADEFGSFCVAGSGDAIKAVQKAAPSEYFVRCVSGVTTQLKLKF